LYHTCHESTTPASGRKSPETNGKSVAPSTGHLTPKNLPCGDPVLKLARDAAVRTLTALDVGDLPEAQTHWAILSEMLRVLKRRAQS
jgi:hypothetical protein